MEGVKVVVLLPIQARMILQHHCSQTTQTSQKFATVKWRVYRRIVGIVVGIK
jgi:hypothetical protein